MMFFINNDFFDQCPEKCGQFLENLVFHNKWASICQRDPSFFLSQALGHSDWKKILWKIQKEPGIAPQPVFSVLISEPLHLEIKALLGFDVESSEVKGRFFLIVIQ